MLCGTQSDCATKKKKKDAGFFLNQLFNCVLDLMIEMEDQTNDVNEAGIPVLDYKTYTDRVFFLPSKDGEKDVMITGKLDIPEARRQTVEQALNQFSNLLNSKSFLINVSTEVDSLCLFAWHTLAFNTVGLQVQVKRSP